MQTIGLDGIDEAKLRSFVACRLTIEADEPPVLRALDVLCHNEMCRADGRLDDIYDLPWWQRIAANVFDLGEPRARRHAAC